MDGDLSFGYNDSFGNQVPSTGNLNFGGTANVKGYYYDPKFLSFNASPYYSQSRLNSNYDSVFDSSGITASAQFFSGSHTPGSFSYSRSYNREGQFGLPDAGTYRTRRRGAELWPRLGLRFPEDSVVRYRIQLRRWQLSNSGDGRNGKQQLPDSYSRFGVRNQRLSAQRYLSQQSSFRDLAGGG